MTVGWNRKGMAPLALAIAVSFAVPLSAGAKTASSQSATSLPIEGLQALGSDTLEQVMVRPGTALSSHNGIILAPITVKVTRRHDEIILQPRDEEHAKEYFTEKLTKALGSAVVTDAKPGTLRLSITLTEFVPNSPFISERKDGLGGVNLRTYSVGEAAFEAVLTDASTGAVIAVIADADRGPNFKDNFNLQSQYGDADNIMRRWAKQIAALLTSPSNAPPS